MNECHRMCCRRITRAVVLLFFIVVLLYPFYLVIQEGTKCERCELSIMSPHYFDLSANVKSPYSYKYRFFRYDNRGIGGRTSRGKCMPVLFVPGSAGNYGQVRSLASAVLYYENSTDCFEFYAVDFLEDFMAFSAHLIRHEASYVNECIRYLASQFPHTDSIILIGHSFGGVVLRLTQQLKNYSLPAHRSFVLTIASPLVRPPLEIALELDQLYYSLNGQSVNVSISSGTADLQVPTSLSMVTNRSSAVINLHIQKMPDTYPNPNHVAMVWEKSFMVGLAKLFHGISKDAVLIPEEAIRSFITREFLSLRENVHNGKDSIECDSVERLSDIQVLKHNDICGATDNSKRCVIVDWKGPFQLFTTEEYPVCLRVYSFERHLTKDKHMIFENPVPVKSLMMPGKSFDLLTITGSRTAYTELASRVTGDSPSEILLRYDCGVQVLFGHSELGWSRDIEDYEHHMETIRNGVSTSISEATEAIVKHLSAFDWVFGSSLNVQQTELRLEFATPALNDLSLSFYFDSDFDNSVQGIAACDERDLPRYSFTTGQVHELMVNSDTKYLRAFFKNNSQGRLTMRVNYLHTFILSLIADPNRLILELYAASLLASLPLWQALLLVVIRDLFFNLSNGLLRILLTLGRGIWIMTLVYLLTRPFSRKQRPSPSRQLIWILFGAALFPISAGIKTQFLLIILIAAHRGLSIELFALIFALLPKVLKASFDIRNLAISIKNLGLVVTFANNSIWRLPMGVSSVLPAIEALTMLIGAQKQNVGFKHSIVKIWPIVVSFMIVFVRKPYLLPIVHLTVLIARAL